MDYRYSCLVQRMYNDKMWSVWYITTNSGITSCSLARCVLIITIVSQCSKENESIKNCFQFDNVVCIE